MRIAPLVAGGCSLLLAGTASAEDRPTEGGLWSFAPEDVVETWDEPTGTVRVHFSVEGPNVTRLENLDDDGAPDFAQDVADATAEAIVLYESLGFRRPTPESAIETELGGSPAYDVYLVDFGGAADGRFGTDGCGNAGCAGFYVVENDFTGYGYATLEEAVDTVSSHEAFHGVQAAYNFLPTWVSEGTATWAERAFDPNSADFVRLANGLLIDTGRPVYQPPGGPVPAFAYGTSLWFDYLTERHDVGLLVDFFNALDDDANAAAPQLLFEPLLNERSDSLADAWPTFARYNLATGRRAGAAQSHPYAGALVGIEADASGEVIAVDARFYPLAANYYNVLHAGGDLWFVNDDALPNVAFSLHPVADFDDDGAVGDAIATWDAVTPGAQVVFEDLPEGGYWVVGAHAAVADGPDRANICVASEDDVDGACPDVMAGSTGAADGSTTADGDSSTTDDPDDGVDPGTTSTGADAEDESSGGEDPGQDDAGGCSCRSSSAPSPAALGVFLVFGLAARRRRS